MTKQKQLVGSRVVSSSFPSLLLTLYIGVAYEIRFYIRVYYRVYSGCNYNDTFSIVIKVNGMNFLLDFIGWYRCYRCSHRRWHYVGSTCRQCWFEIVRKERRREVKLGSME